MPKPPAGASTQPSRQEPPAWPLATSRTQRVRMSEMEGHGGIEGQPDSQAGSALAQRARDDACRALAQHLMTHTHTQEPVPATGGSCSHMAQKLPPPTRTSSGFGVCSWHWGTHVHPYGLRGTWGRSLSPLWATASACLTWKASVVLSGGYPEDSVAIKKRMGRRGIGQGWWTLPKELAWQPAGPCVGTSVGGRAYLGDLPIFTPPGEKYRWTRLELGSCPLPPPAREDTRAQCHCHTHSVQPIPLLPLTYIGPFPSIASPCWLPWLGATDLGQAAEASLVGKMGRTQQDLSSLGLHPEYWAVQHTVQA